MNLSREEVLHLAELARIELTEAGIEEFCHQSQAILGYVERLASVDTSSISHLEPNTATTALAPDVPYAFSAADQEALITAFPGRLGALLTVPAVFANPKKS